MMLDFDDQSQAMICVKCIGDSNFSKWITTHGKKGKCDFNVAHGNTNKAIPVETFAEHVDDYFRENYCEGGNNHVFTPDGFEYEPMGEPYKDILQNEIDCSESVLEAIAENLPDVSHRDITQGAEPFYDDSLYYELISEATARRERDEYDRMMEEDYWYENPVTYQWQSFCHTVQNERRFFKLKEMLDDLFGSAKDFEKGKIKPIYQLNPGQNVYRARLLDEDFTKESLTSNIANHASQLCAPPPKLARSGRMNVEFIPAFYGSFNFETAVAEIRPSISDEIAIGYFEIQKPIKVFDFTVFDKEHPKRVKTPEEMYDWRDVESTRYEFIAEMQEAISKPIRPYEKQREYIPTQIVAEYLKEIFGCEAMIFRSSLHRELGKDNRNIVIFNSYTPFVGTNQSPLTYKKYKIKVIEDVTYKIFDYMEFPEF